MIADLLNQAVPFLGTVGITALEADAGIGRAAISTEPEVRNHVGTLHAAAAFGVAETASGAAVVSILADRLLPDAEGRTVQPVVAGAEIRYRRPARGRILATATIEGIATDDPTADDLLNARDVWVGVELTDEAGREVATASFHWVVTTDG